MTFLVTYAISLAIILLLMCLLWVLSLRLEKFQHCGYLLGSRVYRHNMDLLFIDPRWISIAKIAHLIPCYAVGIAAINPYFPS